MFDNIKNMLIKGSQMVKEFVRQNSCKYNIEKKNESGEEINDKTIFYMPGMPTALASIPMLEALEKEGVSIDHIAGHSFGSVIAGLYGAGLTPEQIKEALHDRASIISDCFSSAMSGQNATKDFDMVRQNVEEIIYSYTGIENMTLAKAKEHSGKTLLIHATRINDDSTKSGMTMSAQNFPNLSVAEACQASSTLAPYRPYNLEYEGNNYTLQEGCYSATSIPIEEYKRSFLGTFKFLPIHLFRKPQIQALIDNSTDVLAPGIPYNEASLKVKPETVDKLYRRGKKYIERRSDA